MNYNEIYQSSWDDVSLEEFIELNNIENTHKTLLIRALETLCYLTDSDRWDDMESSKVLSTYRDNDWLLTSPNTTVTKEIDGKIIKPFNKLTLAEWIDLDSAIGKKELHKVPAIIYRQYKKDEWGNIEYEPYKFKLSDRVLDYEYISVNKIYGIILEAIEYRNKLYDTFSELFEELEGQLDEDEKEELSPSEIREIEKEIQNENRKKRYAWQKLLDNFSNNDWSSIPEILELPHTFIFNMRMMQKVYND